LVIGDERVLAILIFKAEHIPRLFVKEKEEMPGVIIDTGGAGAIDAEIWVKIGGTPRIYY
jgi:hypothetical protein